MDIKSIYRRKQDDENYCWSKRRKVEVRLVGYFGFQYLANEPSSVLSSWSAIWVIGFVGICCAAFAKLGNAYFHFKVKVMQLAKIACTSSMIYRISNSSRLSRAWKQAYSYFRSRKIGSRLKRSPNLSFSRIFRNGVPRKTDLHTHVCKLVEFKKPMNVSLKNFSF